MAGDDSDGFVIDGAGVIRSPGKFEGEPRFVAAYWEDVLSGFEDETGPDNEAIFRLTEEDWTRWPDLEGCAALAVWEDVQGFVYHRTFSTIEALERWISWP